MAASTLIIDVQVLQTPAFERGMGQYISSLLVQLDRRAKIGKMRIVLLYSKNNKKNEGVFNEFTSTLKSCEKVALPLLDSDSTGNTQKAQITNRKVVNAWIVENKLQDAHFILSSIFQTEIYPVLPDYCSTGVIMYDVIPLQLFKTYKPKMRWSDYLSKFSELYKANTVYCISKTTASDLQIYASVDPKKIKVINGGPGELVKAKAPKNPPKNEFILMPTGNDIRKNNRNAILGFEHFRLKTNSQINLIITSYFSSQEMRELKRLSQNVVFAGSVSSEELTWYYKNCEALLFPSIYEGLGMPIIEAMIFDKPVIASGIEVFTEISSDLPYYFNPHQPMDIASAIELALTDSDFTVKSVRYGEVTKEYTWEKSSDLLLQSLKANVTSDSRAREKPRIAVVGPYPSGVSAIGKFIAVLHPYLIEKFEIDYYFESSSIDKELRPNILEYVANQNSVRALSDTKIKQYDTVLYHIGNSNHHTITAARAMLHPGIVIAHDLNFENIFNEMLDRRMIDQNRHDTEVLLNEGYPVNQVYSILSRQKAVVTHSRYAKKIVSTLVSKTSQVEIAQLAVDTPKYLTTHTRDIFTIGLAGILANIKGLEAIEDIARDERFIHDKILIFGLNFAEEGVLDRLRELPNVELATDLSDYEFQQNLKRMSVFVNFRTKYQGEASYATLETMRYGIPVIVRGDFGWYSELPKGTVIKVHDTKEITDEVYRLKTDSEYAEVISKNAATTTKDIYNQVQYVELIEKIVTKISKEKT